MKSDRRYNTPNLAQLDTKKHAYGKVGLSCTNTEKHPGSILTVVCFTDTLYVPMFVGTTVNVHEYNSVHDVRCTKSAGEKAIAIL